MFLEGGKQGEWLQDSESTWCPLGAMAFVAVVPSQESDHSASHPIYRYHEETWPGLSARGGVFVTGRPPAPAGAAVPLMARNLSATPAGLEALKYKYIFPQLIVLKILFEHIIC